MSQHPTRFIYFFGQGQADADGDLQHLVGGKGLSLAEMTRAGLNVPPGFTISAECCDYFHKNQRQWPAGLEEQVLANLQRLENLAGRKFGQGTDPLLVAVRSGAAQSMPGMMDTILNVGLNPINIRAVAGRTGHARSAWEAYYHFLQIYLRTVLHVPEDQLGAMPGDLGQLEALCLRLGEMVPIEPWDQLRAAINAVFGSWSSERAITYRRHHQITGLLGTAVNIQMMCPAEVSGVMFTANPVNPALEQILIESSYGLGEAIVLGKVTPDRFVLDKKSLAIRERNIAAKDYQVASLGQGDADRGEPGGVSPRSSSHVASLNDEQILELAKLGQRVEDYFKTPCDVEWAWSRGQFFLLQSRAIKLRQSIPQNDAEREQVRREEIETLQAMVAPGGTVWSRFNLAEILPEPLPMTWSIVQRFMSGQGGYGYMYRDLGFDPDPALDEIGVFDLVCGRPYCNLSREPRMHYRSLPFEHPFALLKQNPAKAIYPVPVMNPAKASWKFWLFLPAVFFRMWRSSTKLQQTMRTFGDRFEQEIVPPFLREVNQAMAEDWSSLAPPALAAKLETWIQRTLRDFARDSLKPTALAAMVMGNLERVLAQRYQPAGTKSKEGEPTGLQKAQEAIRELVMGVKPAEGTDLAQGLHDLGTGVMTPQAFLQHYGQRGNQEMELARPRWGEVPLEVEQMAGKQSRTQDKSVPSANPLDQIAKDTRLLPFQRKALEAEVVALHRYLGLRETAKHHLLKGYALIRRALVEMDRRFNLEGGIFFLTLADLPRLYESQNHPEIRIELDKLIQRRRRRRELALSLPIPQVLFSDDLQAIGREVVADGNEAWQGVPLSAGVAEGFAWVLRESTQEAAPSDNYILVCPSTDPAWVPLFVHAKGLVMETGGVLSHGAIVAREFGLPAVAGIADVHRRLQTGDRIRLDGASGKVIRLA